MSAYDIQTGSGLNLEIDVALNLCEIVDSPRALAVYLMIKSGEWQEYLDLDIDPADYNDHNSFADDYLVTKVMSKSKRLPLEVDLAAEALTSFRKGEALCAQTNERIEGGELDRLLFQVGEHVRDILGPLTKRNLDRIQDLMRHGNGAAVGFAGTGKVPSDKFRGTPSLTRSLIPFARNIMGERWMELHGDALRVVEGNSFTTVPKNSKTDRGICVEPLLNVYAQLGIGTYLKRRLKASGIDLYDQGHNQRLAERAMRDQLATIDLSMASDTVSLALVYRLLPPEWFHLFSLFRSPVTTLPNGEEVMLEKFSSMGNGYTFELESLIFACVIKHVCGDWDPGSMSVYGDDIIVPQQYAREVCRVLELLGFRVNDEKSFLAGNFFESCGTDWYNEMPVRPFFLNQDVSSGIPQALQIANNLRLYAKRRGLNSCDVRFRALWLRLRRRVPKLWRVPVPESFGDTGLISDFSDVEHVVTRPRDGWEGYVVRHVACRPKKRFADDKAYLLAQLTRNPPRVAGRITISLSDNHETIRGYLGRPRTMKTITNEWSRDLAWT